MEFKENRYDGEEQVVAALADRQKYTTDVASETFRKKVEARLFTQRSMLWTEIRRRAATAPGWQWHRPDALDRIKADPAGARLILAVAGKDGIVSEVHRREIADKPVEWPIDRTRPATWTPPADFLRFETTHTAYGFIVRLKKHDGMAGGLRIGVQAEGGGTWSELNFSEDLALDGDAIERTVEALREIVADGRGLHQGEAHPLRDGTTLPRPRRGNQGGVQARRRGAMSAPAPSGSDLRASLLGARASRPHAGRRPAARQPDYVQSSACEPRSAEARAPAPRKPVIPAKAGIHGFRRRLPSGPAVAVPVNR